MCRFARALEAAVLLAIISLSFILPLNQAGQALPYVSAWDVDVGESLLHGVSAPGVNEVTTAMPLSTSWAAVQYGHFGWRTARRIWLVQCGLLLLAAAALACELAPYPAGLLTMLILAFALDGWLSLTNTLHGVYSLLVVLAAWALARFARKPTAAAGAWAGLSIGTTLLYRSPLILLPALLAGGLAFRRVRRDRAAARGLALAALLPIVMLLPWAKLNYSLHGTVNPAEHMRSDTNIVSGALGLVANIEGDVRSLAPEAGFQPGHVLGWAVRRVLGSPLVFVRAVASRIMYAASFSPWLFLGALVALWLGRGDRGMLAVAVTAVLFLGMHASMPIANHYLTPLRVLLSVLIATASAKLLTPSLAPAPATRKGLALLFAACCATSGALAVASLVPVLRRGPESASPERWVAALAAAPDDAWLLSREAERTLRAGRPREAAEGFARALSRAPLDAETRVLYSYALALSGRPVELERLRLGPETAIRARSELPFFQAAAEIRRRRPAKARALLRPALAAWAGTNLTVNRDETPLERETLAKLRPWGLIGVGGAVLDPLTPAEKLEYLMSIAHEASPEHVADAAAMAGFLQLHDNPRAALPMLLRAVEANAPVICQMPSESLGGPSRSRLPVAFFDACLAKLPGSAKLWADRGVARAGRREPGAVDDLRKAHELDPASPEIVLSLAYLLQERGRNREALALIEVELARSGGGALRAQLSETAARLKVAP